MALSERTTKEFMTTRWEINPVERSGFLEAILVKEIRDTNNIVIIMNEIIYKTYLSTNVSTTGDGSSWW